MLGLSRHVKRALTSFGHRPQRWYTTQSGLMDDLESRGFISQVTKPDKLAAALQERQVVYAGVDPTARSLHVGHLLPMMCLLHFHIRGHGIIPLIGGATALIGDPSGRSVERPHLEEAKARDNMDGLTLTVQQFFERATNYAARRDFSHISRSSGISVRNNIEWFSGLGILEFLRTAGMAARVNSMLARESVQSRLNSQQGISFAEFSYQLLQAYDFFKLNRNAGCTIQIGGSDQWGNIVAGIDLINRSNSGSDELSTRENAYGITLPLLTTSSGEKIGKSAGNAIWLNDTMTSVSDFYQYWMRTTDEDVERLLKLFTLLPLSSIEEAMQEHDRHPEQRRAQRLLANEVTELVHTERGVKSAQAATKLLFDTDLSETRAVEALSALHGDPRLHYVEEQQLFSTPLPKLASMFGVTSSNNAARQLIAMGGLYVNGKPAKQGEGLNASDLIDQRLIILRAGKANHAVLALK